MERKRKYLNPYIMVILSFVIVIAVGSFLLTLPFTQQNGEWGSYIDALVTAVSATCVTGISTYPLGVANTLTFWGQLFTIIMVQIGGLGFVTILTFFISLFSKRMQFRDRFYLAEMVNCDNVKDVGKFVKKIILITIVVEFSGFLLGLPVFLTMYNSNPTKGIWYALFHSISAFNNAGFDLFCGTTSLIGGLQDPIDQSILLTGPLYVYFCIYIMLLIIIGGISFIAIIEIFAFKKRPKQYMPFTKICLLMTAILLICGTGLLLLTDGFKAENPMNFFDCLFQSVSCRTAGFMTYSQDEISLPGKVICSILMFIGGAPLSTAGGMKITTVFVLAIAIICYFKGTKVHSFSRQYSNKMIIKSSALIFISLIILILAYIGFNSFGLASEIPEGTVKTPIQLAYAYELFSAFGTVGFFTNIEPYFSTGSKIVLCILMFLGRLGPMTFFQIFQVGTDSTNDSHFNYIEEEFLVG